MAVGILARSLSICRALAVLAYLPLMPAASAQQPTVAENSIVVIRATATGLDPNKVGQTVSAIATGWFVDNEGRVVTAHHIVDDLGVHDPQTRRFEVMLTPRDAHPEIANVLNEDSAHDLLLLKIGNMPQGRTPLHFRGAKSTPAKDTRICYSGFPGQRLTFQSRCGVIVSTTGVPSPGEYLWDTTLDSAEGLSGAPVYLEDCPSMAVGVVKGKDIAFGTGGLVIPSKFMALFPDLAADDAPCSSAKAAAEAPDTPILSRPFDNTIFDSFPRTVTLRWRPTAHATHYLVWVQYQLPTNGQWFDLPNYPIAVQEEEYTFDFAGAQPGRWRVQGGNDQLKGPLSGWYYFRFSR